MQCISLMQIFSAAGFVTDSSDFNTAVSTEEVTEYRPTMENVYEWWSGTLICNFFDIMNI